VKSKARRRKEAMKIQAEIKGKENRKQQQRKINETKSWLFEKINRIDKPIAILPKKRKKG